MKKIIFAVLLGSIFTGMIFIGGCEELKGTTDEFLSNGWTAFQKGDYAAAIDILQKGKSKASGESLIQTEFALDWCYYRKRTLKAGDNLVQKAETSLDSLYSKYAESIVPLSFIKLDRELNENNLKPEEYILVVARLKSFLNSNPAYSFTYDSSINYKDLVLTGAQISSHRLDYSESVSFIKIVDASFEPGTPGTQAYVNAIITKIEALRTAN